MPSRRNNSPNRSIGAALKRLSYEFQENLPEFQLFVEDVFYTTVLPFVVLVVITGGIIWFYTKIRKWYYPPAPHESHREALILLQADRRRYHYDHYQTTKKPPTYAARAAEALLLQIIRETTTTETGGSTTTYAPAVLSLAAYYLYRRHNPQQALDLLDAHQLEHHDDHDPHIPVHYSAPGLQVRKPQQPTTSASNTIAQKTQMLRLDAQAMQQGQGHMVQSVLAEDAFLSVLAVAAVKKDSQASSPFKTD